MAAGTFDFIQLFQGQLFQGNLRNDVLSVSFRLQF